MNMDDAQSINGFIIYVLIGFVYDIVSNKSNLYYLVCK